MQYEQNQIWWMWMTWQWYVKRTRWKWMTKWMSWTFVYEMIRWILVYEMNKMKVTRQTCNNYERVRKKDLKRSPVFLGANDRKKQAKRVKQWKVWREGGLKRSHWKNLQTCTVGYGVSGAWRRLISGSVTVKTSDNSKLLLTPNRLQYLF